jgi:hypothetical protein
MDGQNMPIGRLDLFNNVCYNWYGRTTDGGCHAVNYVNNYYKMGADTQLKILFSQDYELPDHPGVWQAYISGNIRENKNHTLSQDALNDTYRYTISNKEPGVIDPNKRTDGLGYKTFVTERFFPSYATIHSAKDAMKIVTSYAGATMPMHDEHHVRNIRETLDGTYTYTGSKSKIKGEIDTEADIKEHAESKGWEVYPEERRTEDWDTDQDGMPDWYERLVASNPNTANQNDDPNGDGWTLLEDYLELMAHPYLKMRPNGEGSLELKPYFEGFYGQNKVAKTPTYRLDDLENGVYGASIDGSVLWVKAIQPDAQGVYNIDVTVDDGETTFTQRFGIIISGDATAIQKPVVDIDQIEAAKREFFTTDGHQVTKLKSHEVYVMKVTDKQGTVHTAKIIAK